MFKLSVHQFLYKGMTAVLVLAFALGALGTPTARAVSPGTVVAWGDNYYGQLDIPAGLSNVIAIAAGGPHNMALKSDGTVVAWGYNGHGQIDIPTGLSGVTAISAGFYHSLALKSDGTVVAWGDNYYGQRDVPAGLNDVTVIAAGVNHSVALKSDGTVIAWGDNQFGQIDIPTGLSEVTAIAAGGRHTVAVKSDGTVIAWGDNLFGTTDVPAGLSGVTAVAAGNIHSLALKTDGTVIGWGDNGYGQTSIPDGLSDVIAIAAGGAHSLALKSDGTVVAWGANPDGQINIPDGLSDVTAIAAGAGNNLALVSSPDATPPAITITTPAEGAQYFLGQIINADYACQDEDGGSGLDFCVGTVTNGNPIDTSSLGAKTFTINAADNAGNLASLTHNYSVIYNFSGFFQPVDNLPTVNTVKSGAGVAVKFSLGGDQGRNILAAGYPLSQPIACEGGAPSDAIEQTVAAGNSSISYDPATDTYVYTWKTNKAWAGTCRQLIVKLSDGTEHKANFKFK